MYYTINCEMHFMHKEHKEKLFWLFEQFAFENHKWKVQAIGSHFAWRRMQKWPENRPLLRIQMSPLKVLSLYPLLCASKCIFKGRKNKEKSLIKVCWGTFLPILGLSLFTTVAEAAEKFGSGSSRYDFFTHGNLDLLLRNEKVISHSRRFIYEIVTLAYRISLIRSFFPPSDTGHSQSISTPSMSPLR